MNQEMNQKIDQGADQRTDLEPQAGTSEGSEKPSWSRPANQPDVYIRCPYFPEHELRRSRLPYHLMKCQNHPNAPELLVCPYNFLHRVKPEHCREHELVCEDRVPLNAHERKALSFDGTVKQMKGNGITKLKAMQIIDNHAVPYSAYKDSDECNEEW